MDRFRLSPRLKQPQMVERVGGKVSTKSDDHDEPGRGREDGGT